MLTKADYDELVRLRGLGVESVEMQPERYAVGIGVENSVHWSTRGTLWFLRPRQKVNIAAAIAEYERAQEGK